LKRGREAEPAAAAAGGGRGGSPKRVRGEEVPQRQYGGGSR
jgi:hypothetical protein